MDEIVIVGGGVGGTVTANLLADELAAEVAAGKARIRLITDRPEHVYKPAFLYVAFGKTAPKEYRRPQRDLLHPAVELIVDPVERVDTAGGRWWARAGRRTRTPSDPGGGLPGGAGTDARARRGGRAVLYRRGRRPPVPAAGGV